MAVWVGNLEIIRELIAAGADINKRGRCLGKTPLG
jgi:ankyrin repeat protein